MPIAFVFSTLLSKTAGGVIGLMLISSCLSAQAQEADVFQGYLLSSENKPVPDAHIYHARTSKLMSVSLQDGSFSIRGSSKIGSNDTLRIKHISYEELLLPNDELKRNNGTLHLEESIRLLEPVTIHPLSAREMFLQVVRNMRNVESDYGFFPSDAKWEIMALDTTGMNICSWLDTLITKKADLPFVNTASAIKYFDYVQSRAAVFNTQNYNDYLFEYINSADTLSTAYTQIRCVNQGVSGNEIAITVKNDSFTITKVAFVYRWNLSPRLLTADGRYSVSSVYGESIYDSTSRKLISMQMVTILTLGKSDPITQRFLPIVDIRRTIIAHAIHTR